VSKQFAPPTCPNRKPAAPPAAGRAQPRPPAVSLPRGFPGAPPPAIGPRQAASAQRFASFGNRAATGPARRAPSGDELVTLSSDTFGARNLERGLITRLDGTYNFVRTQGLRRMDQRTLISAKASHAQLSQGKPVIYAGTMRFHGGALDWWSNYSGHYQPIAAFRGQAQLPDDKFVPWQRLQLGGTAMQRGMFRDRRPNAVPAAATEPEEKARREAPPAPSAAASHGGKPAAPSGGAARSAGSPARTTEG